VVSTRKCFMKIVKSIPTLQTYPYKPTQTYTLPTYQPYKSPYTLHTYPTLHIYKLLHAYPAPTYLPTPTTPTLYTACLPCPRNEHADRQCGCILPLMGYYVLRHLLAKLLHLILIDFAVSLLKKEGVLNSYKNLQFWQFAQPLLLEVAWHSDYQKSLNTVHPRVQTVI